MTPSILVAGIGNIFHRDDAFGVSVAAKLARTPLPENVRVWISEFADSTSCSPFWTAMT